MLTFQILDVGETFFRPLEERPVIIGTGAEADLKLESAGVEALHARVEPVAASTTGDGGSAFRIQSLTGDAGVRVNGTAVSEAVLRLGDRVELGEAVLVLGNQVQRAATAGDLLDNGASRRRLPFEDDRRSPQVKRMYAWVVLIGIALGIGLYQWGWSVEDSHLPLEDREKVVDARKRGRFDEARAILDRLDREWAAEDADKRKLVADHRELVENTADEFAKLHASYMAEVLNTTKAEQLKALRTLPKTATFAEREAARILAAGLTEYRLAAAVRLRGQADAATGSRTGKPAVADAGKRRSPPRPAWLDEQLAEIRKLSAAGQHVQAWETARQVLPEVPVEHAGPLLDLLAEVREATRVEMRRLVDQAYAMRAAGKVAAGVKLLREASIRFPTDGELSLLYQVLGNLSAEVGVPMPERRDVVVRTVPKGPDRRIVKQPPVRDDGTARDPGRTRDTADGDPEVVAVDSGPVDKSLLERTLAEVGAATEAGDLDKALDLLEKAIENHKEFQPKLAGFLREEAANLRLIQDLAFAIVGGASSVKGRSIKLADGSRGEVEMVDAQSVHVRVQGKPRVLPWLTLTVDAAGTLAAAVKASPKVRLGVGALGYQRGDAEAAEAYLASLLALDTTLFGAVSKVVGRGRGEVVDKDGYTLVGGKFVARRFLKVEKLAAGFARRLARIAQQTPAQRAEILDKLRQETGEGVDDAIALALRNQLKAYVARFARSKLPKSLGRFENLRAELDKARQHALSLIFDQKTYFYPYKPPAVSGERHSEYMKVQKEVDARVAAVRKIWQDKTKVSLNPLVRKEIGALLWLEQELGRMGEVTDRALAQVEWVRTVPPVTEITIRNYCKSAEERENLEHWLRIEAFNEVLCAQIGSGSAEQVRITNSYRRMFGHRPLAISRKLHAAAQGHAEEMATLGYFGHNSPTPKNKSPYLRMRNHGYQYGISENIAGNPSAAGAHVSWCHSSGHHRNLLNAGHTEFGVGNTGRLWVQNFGRGKDYLDEKDFAR